MGFSNVKGDINLSWCEINQVNKPLTVSSDLSPIIVSGLTLRKVERAGGTDPRHCQSPQM